jgi:hypothetical protein
MKVLIVHPNRQLTLLLFESFGSISPRHLRSEAQRNKAEAISRCRFVQIYIYFIHKIAPFWQPHPYIPIRDGASGILPSPQHLLRVQQARLNIL